MSPRRERRRAKKVLEKYYISGQVRVCTKHISPCSVGGSRKLMNRSQGKETCGSFAELLRDNPRGSLEKGLDIGQFHAQMGSDI